MARNGTVELEFEGRYGLRSKRLFIVGPKPGSRSKKFTHLIDRKYVDFSYTTVANLMEEAKRLLQECGPEATLHIEQEWEYGDKVTHQYVEFWRPMTDAEIALYEDQKRDAEEAARQRKDNELERLRRTHPDWLREDLR